MLIFDCGKKKRAFHAVAFDPTGQILASGGDYQAVIVWDVATGTERVRFAGFTHSAHALQFHPFSGQLLLLSSHGLQVCDVHSGATVTANMGKRYVGMPAFTQDQNWAVYSHTPEDRRSVLSAIVRFGEADHAPIWSVPIGDTADESGYATDLACLPGGEHFVSAEYVSGHHYRNSRRRIAIRSRADGSLLRSSPNNVLGYGHRVYGSHVSDALVVQDGIWLRIHSIDDLTAPQFVVRNDGRKHFTGVAFHPSGRFLAATSNDETVKLYDTTTWEVARTFTWNIGRMRSIAFSPDGTLAAAGGDKGQVVVWDVDL
ncbi:hypothetical protein J8F10_27140 [Gemmata sp. G18]|uniref:WD40 repeat domain-containing protein n=1 Tax=Gemmata palustris TaxID=2822762 RepID=A0ABS5BYX8_9BACT|nr:hypothetical protein [Gemmata palustris]